MISFEPRFRVLGTIVLGLSVVLGVGGCTVGEGEPADSSEVQAGPLSSTLEQLTELSRRPTSTMANPYRLVEDWPTLPSDMEWGAAIGLIPDDTGGLWMLFRSDPPIVYVTADGEFTKRIGEGMIVQAHGFCMDLDGNLWAGDSGSFRDDPSTRGRGFQIHKFSQDGELLMSLGEAGVSRAGENTLIGPTACAVAPNGNIIVADGHWPRPSYASAGRRPTGGVHDGWPVRPSGRPARHRARGVPGAPLAGF